MCKEDRCSFAAEGAQEHNCQRIKNTGISELQKEFKSFRMCILQKQLFAQRIQVVLYFKMQSFLSHKILSHLFSVQKGQYQISRGEQKKLFLPNRELLEQKTHFHITRILYIFPCDLFSFYFFNPWLPSLQEQETSWS